MSRYDGDSRPSRDYDRGDRGYNDRRDDNRWRGQPQHQANRGYRRSRSRSPLGGAYRGRSASRDRDRRWQHDRYEDARGVGRGRDGSRDRDRERGDRDRDRGRNRSRSRSREREIGRGSGRPASPPARPSTHPTDREEGEAEAPAPRAAVQQAASRGQTRQVEEGEEEEERPPAGAVAGGRETGLGYEDRRGQGRDGVRGEAYRGRPRPQQQQEQGGRGQVSKGKQEEDMQEEYEDEDSRAARLLEESRKRREAILAKHKGSGGAVVQHPSAQGQAQADMAEPAPPAHGAHVLTDTHQLDVPMERHLRPAASIFDGEEWDEGLAALRTEGAGGAEGAGAEAGIRAGLDGDAHRQMRPGLQLSASTAGLAGVAAQKDTYDDPEGYYRARPGEILGAEGRYVVSGTGGRGVFSGVVFARDVQSEASAAVSYLNSHGVAGGGVGEQGRAGTGGDDASTLAEAAAGTVLTAAAPVAVGSSGALVKQYASLAKGSRATVAIKVIRANETMRRAGQAEIDILRAIATADPEGRYHVIKLLDTFEHRGHLCLVFEALACNLKELQTKFGKGVGLALKAVREYATQLLLSLALLAKLRIIHADIKPHNVLASERYNVVKLADLGSAFRQDDPDNMPTPYLVSRFYRAPEVILGSTHSPALDMWSLACCLAELYTGTPLFPGEDNNDMLWRQQCMRGRFNHKALRRHIAHCGGIGAEPHFEPETLRFRRHVLDPVSKLPKTVALDIPGEPTDSLASRMGQKRSGSEDRRSVALFVDLLEKMLCLDPERRCTPTEALKHAFIRERDHTGAGRRS